MGLRGIRQVGFFADYKRIKSKKMKACTTNTHNTLQKVKVWSAKHEVACMNTSHRFKGVELYTAYNIQY